MQLPPDFKEFIELLNENSVRYVIVGGWVGVEHDRVPALRPLIQTALSCLKLSDLQRWVSSDSCEALCAR